MYRRYLFPPLALCLTGLALFASARPARDAKEFANLGHRLARARVAADGTLWMLSAHSDLVRQYAPDGSTLEVFALNGLKGDPPGELVDFAFGKTGNLVMLHFPRPESKGASSELVRFEGKQHRVQIPLSKPLAAWKIDIDENGDIYLLGLEMGIYRQIGAGSAGGQTVYLVHRFDERGTWKESYLPLTVPDSQAAIDSRLFNPIFDRSSFLVEAPGRAWFLQTVPDVSRPVWDWEKNLYLVTDSGTESTVPTPPTEEFFLLGLHLDEGRIRMEWGSKTNPESKLLTDSDGKVVDHMALFGMLVAFDHDRWYSVVSHGSNDSRVLQMRRMR